MAKSKEVRKITVSKIKDKLKTKKAIATIIVVGLGLVGVAVPGGTEAVISVLNVLMPILGM
ncbi:MAG: hypothetical protein Unbinned6284contig1004_14 [Prokaryotic dsDNA virus sp.]|nr:MAG: hypothetical protein Unbinned6284contig1004_14 [Prokaryotic dsDNA virus sp.]|tara:strand:+ start:28678 stop:28860 length:183 start_codon:yes stop_codon:yes gene_type:complete